MTMSEHAINFGKEEVLRLRDRLRTSLSPRGGVLPLGATLKGLQEKWLPANSFVCRSLAEGCDPSSCNNRCSAAYWLSHCGTVAALMRSFAEVLGDDPDLYQAAGEVHDLDYVKTPHDLGGQDVAAMHPVPVVRDLMEMSAPAILSLAVLEHSPHLSLEPSSPLSEALIVCDDAATLASTGYALTRHSELPAEIIERFSGLPRDTVGGKYRHGMPGRMARALKSLSTRDYHFPSGERSNR